MTVTVMKTVQTMNSATPKLINVPRCRLLAGTRVKIPMLGVALTHRLKVGNALIQLSSPGVNAATLMPTAAAVPTVELYAALVSNGAVSTPLSV